MGYNASAKCSENRVRSCSGCLPRNTVKRRHLVIVCFVFAVTMAVCRTAYANALSPFVYFWPGVISIMLPYAFPASVLAAFLERPFLTAAGLKHRALVLSLRANFVSTIVGIVLVPIGYPLLEMTGPVWCFLAFCISCVVEIFCLRRFSRQHVGRGWVVLGNAISSGVLMILPPAALAIKHVRPELAWRIEPHEDMLLWTTLGVSLVVFIGSFMFPVVAQAVDTTVRVSTPSSKEPKTELAGTPVTAQTPHE